VARHQELTDPLKEPTRNSERNGPSSLLACLPRSEEDPMFDVSKRSHDVIAFDF
jgi:hypothetical protein